MSQHNKAQAQAQAGQDSSQQREQDADVQCVQRVLAGDQEAFAEIVERYQSRVYGHMQRMVGPRDAEDLSQEAFIRAYQKLSYYRHEYRFISWLLVMASRLALNFLRDQKPHRLPSLEDCTVPSAVLSPTRQVEQDDERDHLARCLDRILSTMNDKARLLYELKFRQELSLEEMAQHLSCSVSAVKVRVHRLRHGLQEALREQLESVS